MKVIGTVLVFQLSVGGNDAAVTTACSIGIFSFMRHLMLSIAFGWELFLTVYGIHTRLAPPPVTLFTS